MSRTWNTTDELLDMIAAEAKAGRNVRLSPQTAMSLVHTLREARHFMHPPGGPGTRFRIDVHGEGSSIYRLNRDDDIERVEAWARNTMVGRTALSALEQQYPRLTFEQRRGAWVEGRVEGTDRASKINPPAS